MIFIFWLIIIEGPSGISLSAVGFFEICILRLEQLAAPLVFLSIYLSLDELSLDDSYEMEVKIKQVSESMNFGGVD